MAFGSEQWMYSAGGFYPHEIDNSARLDTNSYFTRTPSSAGNRKTWTWSGWVKLSNSTGGVSLFSAGSASDTWFTVYIDGSAHIQVRAIVGGSNQFDKVSTQSFRDFSSWYHFVIEMDTTQSTAEDRVKVYVNGERITSWSGNVISSQNADTSVNNTNPQNIGRLTTGALYLDGYLAEVNFIDGQALDPTSFGETKSGVWIPKEYSGTYGTNGFHLDFSDSTRTRETDTALVTAPFGGNAEFARVEDGLAVISNTTIGQAFTLVQYDLGSAKEVNYYRIEDLYFTGNVSTFQLQYSNDNSSWTSAVSFAITNNVQDFAAALSITARYWRIRATAFGTNGSARIDCLQLFTGQVAVDTSGNGNDFSSINVFPSDVMLDSPTNNFATFNVLEAGNGTYAEANLKFSANTSGHQMASSTASISSGKWYTEILIQAVGGTYPHIGITPVTTSNNTYVGNNGYGYRSDGYKQGLAASAESYGASYAARDIIGIAFDADSGSITFYKNGSSQGVAFSSIDTSKTWRFSNSLNSTGGISTANFGQDSSFAGDKTAQGNTDANGIGDFYYAPPADHLALCSANLPDTAIDPAKDDIPADYFNPVLYTGNGSTQSITGIGFQPDWVWIKERSSTSSHSIFDQVRGPQKYLASNSTSAEGTSSSQLTSFDADGFTTGASGGTNQSGQTYVAWNWKAGGTAVANTDGTIASQVSANPRAGFSIVTYTGNGTAGATVGHGLNQPIDLYFQKNRSAVASWPAIGKAINDAAPLAKNYMFLNSAIGATSASQGPGDSSTIELYSDATNNASSNNYVCYAFHSVEGFSKIGSYTGNGSTDGPFVYCGFKPAFVMIKRIDSTGNWLIQNNKALGYNPSNSELYANLVNAEATADRADFLSNGFKSRINSTENNASGGTYIYMAFAEMPFKYANAR